MAEMIRDLVAAEVRAELARQRMTQDELARRLGVSQPWVSSRVRGVVVFDVVDLQQVADALGVDVMQFLTSPVRAA